jgi:hypothetical protein
LSTLCTKKVIADFLESPSDRVMVLNGSWGVGKTFFWNSLAQTFTASEPQSHSWVSLPEDLAKYSYVSLFGMASITQIKSTAYFEATKIRKNTNRSDVSNFDEIIEKTEPFKAWLSKRRGILVWLSQHPKVAAFLGNTDPNEILASMSGQFLSNHIICFDDFERISSKLGADEILGFISELSEKRRCKVLIIMNQHELEDSQIAIYKRLREKVVDIEHEYMPTAEEGIHILQQRYQVPDEVMRACRMVQTNNIRILERIIRYSEKLSPLMKDYLPITKESILNSLALYALSYLTIKNEVPPPEYFRAIKLEQSTTDQDFEKYFSDVVDQTVDEEAEQRRSWKTYIEKFGYSHTSELDLVIFDLVERGYIDTDKFTTLANQFDAENRKHQSGNQLSSLWSEFRHTISLDDNDFINRMSEIVRSSVHDLGLPSINSVVNFLIDMDRKELAIDLLEIYIEANRHKPEKLDVGELFPRSDIRTEVSSRLENAFKEEMVLPCLKEVLKDVGAGGSWGARGKEVFLSATVAQYYDVFDNLHGAEFEDCLRGALFYKNVSNADQECKVATTRAIEALLNVAQAHGKAGLLLLRNHGISPPGEKSS